MLFKVYLTQEVFKFCDCETQKLKQLVESAKTIKKKKKEEAGSSQENEE